MEKATPTPSSPQKRKIDHPQPEAPQKKPVAIVKPFNIKNSVASENITNFSSRRYVFSDTDFAALGFCSSLTPPRPHTLTTTEGDEEESEEEHTPSDDEAYTLINMGLQKILLKKLKQKK